MEFNFQEALFNYIFSTYSDKKNAHNDLQRILKLSQPAIYKRINGTKLITSDEISVLVHHYRIPPSIFYESFGSRIVFDFPPLGENQEVTGSYLTNIKADLEEIAKDQTARILYLSTDLPFFYYFLYKEIAWFKLYLFQHAVSDTSINKLPKISFLSIGKNEEKIFEDLKILYSSINSEEIWTSRAFLITIDQIKYFVEANLFQDPEEALLLMDKMEAAADRLLEIVNHKNKGLMVNKVTKGGDLSLYYNDFNRFNPVIITESGETESIYLTYNLPQYLYTTDQRFIEYSKKWIFGIKQKAYSLTENSDIEQIKFFERIKKHIRAEKEIMKSHYMKRL